MTLTRDVFPKLRTAKNLVTSMSKKSRFKRSFGKQHGKHAQTIVQICMEETLPYLLIAVKAIVFQKGSFSDMQNLKTVSSNTE